MKTETAKDVLSQSETLPDFNSTLAATAANTEAESSAPATTHNHLRPAEIMLNLLTRNGMQLPVMGGDDDDEFDDEDEDWDDDEEFDDDEFDDEDEEFDDEDSEEGEEDSDDIEDEDWDEMDDDFDIADEDEEDDDEEWDDDDA